jgi:hypothetical protein
MHATVLSGGLEDVLGEYVQAAGHILRAEIAGGAEVELELCSRGARGGARTAFYSCRPLTGAFIRERESLLTALEEHERALAALVAFDGLDRYLASAPGEPRVDLELNRATTPRAGARTRARAALQALLEEVFEGQTDFEVGPERIMRALQRLGRAEPVQSGEATILVATLRGMTIASSDVKLTKGLSILVPTALEGVPEAALAGEDGTPEDEEGDHLLVALTLETHPPTDDHAEHRRAPGGDCGDPLERGRAVLLDLLRALRLYGDGRVTLGSLAWTRSGDERRWRTVLLGAGGRPHGMLVVSPEQEDELRAFCSLVSRRAPAGNELAWALRRFEMGCERASAHEGLSDHLLALRALLEPEGPASGLLAGRVAALCATAKDRVRLTERMTKAQKLERDIVARSAAERASTRALAGDVADHLRALLRDVICGHLAPDLARVADELLSADVEESDDVGDPTTGRDATVQPVGAGEQQVLVQA